MHLIAMHGDARVDATKHTRESWADLQASEWRKELTMPLCGIRAVAKTRGENTRYFAHHTKAGCSVEHGGESPQHLAMKEALATAIDAVPGWHSVIEFPHPSREWVIDVLAQSDTAPADRVAFEVQLSSQSPEAYFTRSDRYFSDRVFPVWLVPRALEPHRINVPTVVTGFGKTSPVPEDPAELHHLEVVDIAGRAPIGGIWIAEFVRVLLTAGPDWPHGSPAEQRSRLDAKDRRAEANRRRNEQEANELQARYDEMNRNCATPASAYGEHRVLVDEETFVFATLAPCYKCSNPMILWAVRGAGPGKHWVGVPDDPKIKPEFKPTRYENSTVVHRAVDRWISDVQADIPKAHIQTRSTRMSGETYSAFVCPTCDAVFGENFLVRILKEKWSVIGGPDLAGRQPRRNSQRERVAPKTWSPETDDPKRSRRQEFEGRSPEKIEADRAAAEAWVAKDRASARVSPGEAARREQERVDRAAEIESFNANPQYVKHGARHICQACGGVIDDMREGQHKGGACRVR